jgi:hypothetical protein
MGFEPTRNFDVTDDGVCDCEFCQGYRAARALHVGSLNCPALASLDADLHHVIAAWGTLPEAIRRAVMALIGLHNT